MFVELKVGLCWPFLGFPRFGPKRGQNGGFPERAKKADFSQFLVNFYKFYKIYKSLSIIVTIGSTFVVRVWPAGVPGGGPGGQKRAKRGVRGRTKYMVIRAGFYTFQNINGDFFDRNLAGFGDFGPGCIFNWNKSLAGGFFWCFLYFFGEKVIKFI